MKKIVLIALLIVGIKAVCQTDSVETYVFKYKEDSLSRYFNKMYLSTNDKEKIQINEKIMHIFNEILINPETFSYSFDSLTKIGKIHSPDAFLRIYSWNIPLSDGAHSYFSFIQLMPKKAKKCKVFELKENSKKIDFFDKKTLKHSEWYGALYYDIIPIKYKGKKLYTILSFDFNDIFTNKKIIDVLYFSDDYEELFFGKPIFQTKNGMHSRLVFEYSSRVVMSLKYDKEYKQIVFDHLSPIKPSMEGSYRFYGPDLSFDALRYEKDKWVYIEDVNMTNQ